MTTVFGRSRSALITLSDAPARKSMLAMSNVDASDGQVTSEAAR
jgi:hypothetical protein